jgi:hypothetical protein
MTNYSIKRWDVVMFNNSITKVPMIYIKPDIAFLKFVRENSFAVMVTVNGTGTIYDGKQIPGVVDKSCYVPNCRPNYFEKTGYYIVTLYADWYGYPHPEQLGTATFNGLKQDTSDEDILIKSNKNILKSTPSTSSSTSSSTPSSTKKGMNTLEILAVLALLSLLIVIIILIARRDK